MEIPHITEDEMAEIKKYVLTKLRPYLCDKIRAERHFDYLRSRMIITRDDAEEINCWPTQTKRTGALLDVLAENPRGLDVLIESIRQSRSQNFIIAKITDEVQRVKNEKIEALRASSSSSSKLSSSGTTSDLSRTFSDESTMLLHPEGEESPSTSIIMSSFDLHSFQKGVEAASEGDSAPPFSSSAVSSALPRPGDPGAPPLPEEAPVESLPFDESKGCSSGSSGSSGNSGGGDPDFQPLRSRSLGPTL